MMMFTAPTQTQKVVVVNGSNEALGVMESLLDAGHYDMVFVAAAERAYSTIRRELPHLVVLCTTVESLDGVQLLSMLKLDPVTKDIPVLSYTCEDQTQDFDAAISDLADQRGGLHSRPSSPRAHMN